MKPLVGIIMGSRSDWETLRNRRRDAREARASPHEVRVVSAHRTPDLLFEYAATARDARPAGDHRRRGRRGAPAGHGGRQDARCRCSACRCSRGRSTGWTRCCRSCRCPPACRSARSPSAPPARPMPRCSPPPSSAARTRERRAALEAFRAAQTEARARAARPAQPRRHMTIGIVGAGQLGRMLALAGYPLGTASSCFLDSQRGHAAARRSRRSLLGDVRRRCGAARARRRVDVVTYDFENVPVGSRCDAVAAARTVLAACDALARVAGPPAREGAVRPPRASRRRAFAAVDSLRRPRARRSLRIGLPGVLKTRRLGYDGKGQAVPAHAR